MSYDIFIGELSIYPSPDELLEFDAYETSTPDLRVNRFEQDDAPEFVNDELTGKGNHRHPSYIGWGDFARETGLYDLFFDTETGIMRDHPGVQVLRPRHHERIAAALATWRARYPAAQPGFGGWTDEETPAWVTDEGASLARLIWLEWWVRWALENCRVPAIYNY